MIIIKNKNKFLSNLPKIIIGFLVISAICIGSVILLSTPNPNASTEIKDGKTNVNVTGEFTVKKVDAEYHYVYGGGGYDYILVCENDEYVFVCEARIEEYVFLEEGDKISGTIVHNEGYKPYFVINEDSKFLIEWYSQTPIEKNE